MRNLCVFLIFPAFVLGNVDMVMGDVEAQQLVISWSSGGSCHIGKYLYGEFQQIKDIQGYNYGALGISMDDYGYRHILYAPIENSCILSSLNTYSYTDLSLEYEADLTGWFPYQGSAASVSFLDSSQESWDALLGIGSIAFTSMTALVSVVEISWEMGENGLINPLHHAEWGESFWYWWNSSDIIPGKIVGPVATISGNPLMASTFGYSAGWSVSHCFTYNPELPYLQAAEIGSEEYTSEIATVMALGSSSDSEPILLFSNDFGQVNWFEFSPFSPEPEDSIPLPWAIPVSSDPVAMTSRGEMPGILMVWWRDGVVRCRHWNDGWNNYDYPVQSTSGSVAVEDIAVCCGSDGYWVAWLESGGSEPCVVFVPYDDVTDMEINASVPVQPAAGLRPMENPVSDHLSIYAEGIDSGVVTVHNAAGRTVIEMYIHGEGVHSIGHLPCPGVYFVKLQHTSGELNCRVLSI